LKIQTTITEALFSLIANRGRNSVVALGLCFCIMLPAYLEMREGQATVDAYLEGIDSGNGVVVASRESGGLLDADVCLAQSRDSSVLSSGTLSQGGLVSMASAPGMSLQVAAYGGNYLRVIDPSFEGSLGATSMGAAGAHELGLAEGRHADLSGIGLTRIAEIVDAGSRVPAQGRWIYRPDSSTDGAKECWLEARPGMRAAVIDDLRAKFGHVGDLRVTTLVAAASEETVADWDLRATRWAWAPFAFTAALLYFLVSLPRRTEIGLRLSLGASRPAVLLQLYVENFVLLSLAVGSSVLWLGLTNQLAGGHEVPRVLGLIVAQRVACAYLILAGLIGSWLVSRSVFVSLRSR
jgi:hypothetical protein